MHKICTFCDNHSQGQFYIDWFYNQLTHFLNQANTFLQNYASLTVVISKKIVSGQGQEYSETEQTDPGNSGNASGSGNSSDDRFEELGTTKSWTIGQTGIPEIEYTDIEAERNRISEDIGSGIGSNRRYISPEKKSGSPSETITGVIQPGNNLRGAASFSSNSGGAIGAWPSNEMTVKVTPMEVIL